MCYFAHLGVRIVDDRRRFPDPTIFAAAVQQSAIESSLPLDPLKPSPGSFLSRAMTPYQLRFTFRVGHCACDWDTAELTRVRRLVSRLLIAREVKTVAFLFYMIDGALRDSAPSSDNLPRTIELTNREFATEREMKDRIFVIHRAAGEIPTASLRSL
jgi:hypothetical protein